jgi:hydroxyacylglutathione hydrolase
VPGATHIPLGYLRDRLRELPKDCGFVTQCMSGGRSAIAASILRSEGFERVSNLIGGLQAWKDAGLPVTHE